jgi:hypothetical protein
MCRAPLAEAMEFLSDDPEPHTSVAIDGGFVVREHDQ